eukprot:7316791-Lingulodinium_polyedra.AAC.1
MRKRPAASSGPASSTSPAAKKPGSISVSPYSLTCSTLQIASTAALLGLSVDSYRRLCFMGAPIALYEVMRFVRQHTDPDAVKELIMVEYFCGVAALTRAFHGVGLPAAGVDFDKDKDCENINADAGIIFCVTLAMALAPEG